MNALQKRLVALLLLALFACLPSAARADVIWEPDNDFYWKNQEQCQYLGRQYLPAVAGGLYLWDEPEGREGNCHLEEDQAVTVYFLYELNGRQWGLVEPDNAHNGWVPMDWMRLKYDSQAFREEHAGQISDQSRTLYLEDLDGALLFWTYPGSGEIVYALSTQEMDGEELEVSGIYTDGDGREWGNCAYYYGIRDVWICLSDPSQEDLPVTPTPEPDLLQPDELEGSIASSSLLQRYLLPICLVGGVVLVTLAVMLAVFLPRRKR